MTRSRSSRKKTMGRSLLRLLFRLGLLAAFALAGWVIYLDAEVTDRFEGRRFEVPSRVYARPLELYDGASVSAAALARDLELAGYRQGDSNQPGRYQRSGQRFVIHTRGFLFPDGEEPARRLSLRVAGDQVSEFSVLNGPQSAIVRLEPARIGGIYPAHREDRVLVQLAEVPQPLIDGLLAVEDQNFYDHFGIAPLSIARAFVANIKAGHIVQGGSTLTQQLVKNLFLTREQTLVRKANEALMSLLLEFHYRKDVILETYLNEVYLGQAGNRSIHGFGLASQFYFGERLNSLKVHQMALLVGMVKGPSYYNPRRHPERATQRRNLVLAEMAEAGLLDVRQAEQAKQRGLDLSAQPSYNDNLYPAYIDLVRRHLARDYRDDDLRSEGLRIFTTLDPAVQQASETAVRETLPKLAGSEHLEGALVVTGKDSGEVLALVGGKDPQFAGFNRALDARRPIGSLVKPFVYLTALQQPERYTLVTPLQDKGFVLEFDDGRRWQPSNYDGEERGEVPLHRALSHSLNLPTVRVGLDVGIPAVQKTLLAFGAPAPIPRYPSVLLGSLSLTPVQVAQMYQGLATAGFNTPLRSIREVTDANNQPLSRYSLEVDQVADNGAVHLVQYAMQEAMREGTGRSAYNRLPEQLSLAGKTGTTDDGRDAWFAGFSGDLLAVAWVGRDDNRGTALTGASGALPVWSEMMARVPQYGFSPVVPEHVQYHWVHAGKQALTDEHCQNARLMPFITGSEPDDFYDCGGAVGRQIRSWFEGLFQ